MSKFGQFTFTKLKVTEEILSLKRRFTMLPMSKRNVVISGVSIKNPLGSSSERALAKELIAAKIPILNLSKWACQANVDEMTTKKAEVIPFKVELKKAGVTQTTHITLSVEDKVLEQGMEETPSVDSVCVMGLIADPVAPCNPANLLADRVVHHINFRKKKVAVWKQGPYMGQSFLGAVSEIYNIDLDASPEDVSSIKQADKKTRNELMDYYIQSVPACLEVKPYVVPKSGEIFPIPQVFSPSKQDIGYETFMKQIPKILGNLGGESCGMGYYAQTHVDGDAAVTGSARKLMEFVTDFRPIEGINAYYTSATDIRKAWGMYYRCVTEMGNPKILIVYSASVINTTLLAEYIQEGKIKKGGVIGLPFSYFQHLNLSGAGFYSNDSISVRVGKIDIQEGVSSFETMIAAYSGFDHVQCSVSLPVALKMLKTNASTSFRASAMLRKCKVIYDDNVEDTFENLLWTYGWGLQHAYYWRWLSGPLLATMPGVIVLSPRYQYHAIGKVKMGMPMAMFKALSEEDIEEMRMSLPSIQIVPQKEEEVEEEEVVELVKKKKKVSKPVVQAKDLAF